MFIRSLIVALVVASSSSWAAKPTKPPKPTQRLAAVMTLETPGSSASDRQAIGDALRGLVPGYGYVAQEAAATQKTLRDVQALGLSCDDGSVDCAVRVGALAGLHIVVVASVTGSGDALSIELFAVDIAAGKETGRVRLPLIGQSRGDVLDEAMTAVLRPESWRGSVLITVPQRGASIYVDGIPRGFTPLSTAVELTPGVHPVFIGLEGYAAYKESVVVGYREQVEVKALLVPGVSETPPSYVPPKPPPPPPPPPTTTSKPEKRKALRIAFYDIERVGVDERVGHVMGSYLVEELRKRERVSVLDGSEIRVLIGDATKGENARSSSIERCSDEACFSEVAEALGAESVVVGTLTQVGTDIVFGLRRIDQSKQEVTATFLQRVPAQDTTALLPLVGKSIAATFPDLAVRAGQTLGVDERAAAVLNPPPLPPVVSGGLYALTATSAVAGGVLLSIAAVSAVGYETDLQRFKAAGSDASSDDENAALRAREDVFYGSQIAGFGAVSAAVVFGVAAVVTGAFTDWSGARDDARGQQ